MPCYLFTFHSYGSWLPDRARGFVRRGKGILQRDQKLAACYRSQMKQGPVYFNERIQASVIEALLDAATHLACRTHAIATDNQHIHIVSSWHDEKRGWEPTRMSFKKSITLKLKSTYDKRKWLARDASRKRLKDAAHFDYLINSYLPKHRGRKWDERVGYYATEEDLIRKLSDET